MLCVLARIDEQARCRLRLLQKEAEKCGIPLRHLHGHITLAVYTGEDPTAFAKVCKQILTRYHAFAVHYEHLAILREPSTIVACLSKTGVLDDLQSRIAVEWAEKLNIWSQRSVWLPHTTLVQDPKSDLDTVLKTMKSQFEPFDAAVSCIEFSLVKQDGYEIIDSVNLKE